MVSRKVQLGSVISGTMRAEDLIPAFLDTLREIDPEAAHKIEREDAAWEEDYEAACWMMESLTDALEGHSPPFCYFGAHPGDGSDYGFWIDWESLDEACTDGPLAGDCTVYRIDAGEPWPTRLTGDTEYILEVNDHGNATLYTREGEEIWSVV
jgi:hypothetical protein